MGHNECSKNALDKACNNLGIEITRHQDMYSINSVCFPNDKHIFEWVWYLNREQSKILIDSMLLDNFSVGDKGTNGIIFNTISMRDDFQRLAFHAGYSSDYHLNEDKGIKERTWTLRVYKNDQSYPQINDSNSYRLERWEDFKGKVYCCSVEGEGIIYVRRDGKSVWCGNSRMGQKGTVGITLSSADMPSTKDGIQPDIIMNPCAIPTRMTMGQPIECVASKTAVLKGLEVDATPFMKLDAEKLMKELEEQGFKGDGTEYLYNGMTGKKIKVMIFIGPTYYLRLKHMVYNKVHSRARGPRTVLTKLPLEGRARDGGLRFGEMERDAIVGHGASRFLHERYMKCADGHIFRVCDNCGMFASKVLKRVLDGRANASEQVEVYQCPSCGNKTNISKVEMPYSCKLMFQELMSLNIAPRITTVRDKHDY